LKARSWTITERLSNPVRLGPRVTFGKKQALWQRNKYFNVNDIP
jgi:hypothetical protein